MQWLNGEISKCSSEESVEGLSTGRQKKVPKGDDQGASGAGRIDEGEPGQIVDEDNALVKKEWHNLL